MKRKTSRLSCILIRLDLMVYIIVSIIPFVGGSLLIGESSINSNKVNSGPPTFDEAALPFGIILLIVGSILLVVTFIKIRDTLKTL